MIQMSPKSSQKLGNPLAVGSHQPPKGAPGKEVALVTAALFIQGPAGEASTPVTTRLLLSVP